jgi:hypothetical protein
MKPNTERNFNFAGRRSLLRHVKILSYHSFVVLESTDESIIREINKIQLSDNRILALDKMQGTYLCLILKGLT